MAVSQALLYSSGEAADKLEALLHESGIEPTTRIAQARASLAATVAEEAEALAEIDQHRPMDSEAMSALAAAVADGSISTGDAVAQIRRTEDRELRRLQNKLTFVYSKRADRILRNLGNALIADILAPWADRIVSELVEPAAVVVEHGPHAAVHDDKHKAAYDRAEKLVAELHTIYAHANQLRGREVLSPLADGYDPRLLAFKAPHRLAEEEKAVRETWWMAFAVVNGAGPIIRSSYEAEAAAKIVA
ncbi:hypothetical protein ACGFIU_19455 [Rhodococcus oryzae]|uniref:hypothetical protein n=1 Tax=Rhodococcus oryzae TaxID=2571143 RepID=UPI00371B9799